MLTTVDVKFRIRIFYFSISSWVFIFLLYPKVKPLPHFIIFSLLVIHVLLGIHLISNMLVYNDALSNLSFSFYYLKNLFSGYFLD